MIKVNEIAFVGYPVTDRERARSFYDGLLATKPSLDIDLPGGYWIEYDVGRETLALSNFWSPAASPAIGPTAALEVQDFEATVTRLKDAGVRFAEEAKSAMCSMSMIVDPDGNSLWIHKRAAHRAAYAGLEIPFVCYPVTDKQRAREFYEGLLGLQRPHADYEAAGGFWSEYDAGADTLALCSYWKPPTEPCMGPVAALEVDDFDEAVSALRAAAVPFAKEPKETPGCHLCIVTDPDGNSLFIHKRKAVHA